MPRSVKFLLQTVAILASFTVFSLLLAFVVQFFLIFENVPFFILFIGAAILLGLSQTSHSLRGEENCSSCKVWNRTVGALVHKASHKS